MLRLSTITVFTVKSLRGQAQTEAAVEPWGLAGDRRYMVVDPDGRFLTQRQCPALATLDAIPHADGITLSCTGHPTLRLPVPAPEAEPITVSVWRDSVQARAVSPEADRWLAALLGRPCRLAYMEAPDQARPVDPAFAQAGDRVSFADGFPLLVACTASLDDLNRRLAVPVGMERFRPNLVVEGTTPWAEDGWRRLRIGTVLFDAVKPCSRCIVTTTDQHTGLRDAGAEPLRTLQQFRRDARGQVLFGQNLIPRSAGRVAVGDPVEVLTIGADASLG